MSCTGFSFCLRAKNETYGVGEEWNDGCELKCVCNDKVEIVCQERCKVMRDASFLVLAQFDT